MRIHLEHLTFEGLGPFKNQEEMDFAGASKTVIFAPNGRGKTSTIDLVRWLIEGPSAVPKFRSLDQSHERSIINWSRFKEGKGARAEAIIRMADRRRFRITRSILADGSRSHVMVEEETSERDWEPVDNPVAWLSTTFPHERLGFNLLTGEHINEFVDELRGRAVKDAVEKLLEMPEVVEAKNATERVHQHLEKELKKKYKKQKKQQSALKKRNSLEADLEDVNDTLSQVRNDKEQANEEIEKLTTDLARIDDVERLAEERDQLEGSVKRLKADIDAQKGEVKDQLNAVWRPLLRGAAADQIATKLEEYEAAQAERNKWLESQGKLDQLKRVLEKETCVCLRPIDEEAEASINEEIKKIQGSEPDTPDLPAKPTTLRMWRHDKDLPAARRALRRYQNTVAKKRDDIQRQEDRLESISSRLSESEVERARQLEADITALKERRKALEKREQQLISRKLDIKRDLDKARKKLGGSADTALLESAVDLARRYARVFDDAMDRALPHYRDLLQERVHTLFHEMFDRESGFQVEISESSMIPHVKTSAGEPVAALGEGDQTRLGIALLFAIREVASERPFLLLDAPFSTLDDEGEYRLLDLVAEQDGQVIIFTKNAFPEGPWFDAVAGMEPSVYVMEWTPTDDPETEGYTAVQQGSLGDLMLKEE